MQGLWCLPGNSSPLLRPRWRWGVPCDVCRRRLGGARGMEPRPAELSWCIHCRTDAQHGFRCVLGKSAACPREGISRLVKWLTGCCMHLVREAGVNVGTIYAMLLGGYGSWAFESHGLTLLRRTHVM